MLGDSLEITRKLELQELLDKLKRNVEGVGGEKILKENYPIPYSKLMNEICNKCNAYLDSALSHVEISLTVEEAQSLWKAKSKEIRKAIKNYSSDDVQKVVSDYIFELCLTYKEKVLVGYEEDESLSA